MRFFNGTFTDGKVEIPEDFFVGSSRVMVVTMEPGEPVHLTSEEAEFLELLSRSAGASLLMAKLFHAFTGTDWMHKRGARIGALSCG